MDPNKIEKEDIVENASIPGDTSGKATWAVRRLYADGRTETTFYYRGDDAVQKVVPGKDIDQEKIWQAQAKTTQTQTDQAERKVTRTYTGTDPNTGKPATITEYETGAPKYEEIKSAASTAQPGQVQGVPNNPTIQTQQPDGTWKTSPNPGYVPPAGQGGTIMERPDGVYIVKPDGTSIKTDLAAKPAPSSHSTVKGEDGSTYVVTVDADGNVSSKVAIPAPTAGPPVPASATGWSPEPSKVDMGIGPRKQAIAGMLESGVFGPPEDPRSVAKANVLLKQDLEHATLVSQNIGNIQQGENVVYQGGISQRASDQSQINQRLQAATTTYNQTVGEIMKSAGKAKTGAAVVGALREILNNARLFAEQFGGLKDSPTIQPGANMTRTSELFTGPVAPAATPAPPGTGLESGGAVGGGGVPVPPAAAGIDPNAPSPPPAPEMPFTPPPTGAPGGPGWQQPTSITDQAQQARQLSGMGGPDPMAPTPPPIAGAVDPNQAAQAQAMIGQRAPVTGGTLAWAKSLGFPTEVINAFMAIEDGPQVAA